MKRFLIVSGLYLTILFIVFVGIKVISSKLQVKNFNSAFVEKLYILKSFKDKKKIVLIGGSNIGFGISAKMITDSLGISCLNLGHHAALGLNAYQDFICSCISEQDIIILSPEYNYFFSPLSEGGSYFYDLNRRNLNYFFLERVDKNPITTFLSYMDLSFFEKIENRKGIYRTNCINDYGDVVTNCDVDFKHVSNDTNYILKYSKNEISDTLIKSLYFPRHPNTFLLFPNIDYQMYVANKGLLDSLNVYYEKMIPNKLLSPLLANVYPDSLFLDTHYHLRCIGKEQRTKALIKILRKKLKALQ